jgi:hypothetical protein
MRWLLMVIVLMVAPMSFMDDDTEEPCISAVVQRGTCPGGKCPPKRPRPTR